MTNAYAKEDPLGVFEDRELVGLMPFFPYSENPRNKEMQLRLKLIRLHKHSKFEKPFTQKELKMMYDSIFIIVNREHNYFTSIFDKITLRLDKPKYDKREVQKTK